MDIDLLSKMVKELILDNDKVVLPGLGSFVAEIVPSTFSDKGYTINPPYRRLYFRSKPDEGDALAVFYAESNSVDKEVAGRIIKDYIEELKAVLFSRKTVVFPGLGRLRATKENNVFFVADEDLDIYPSGFGLEPISLKTHQETPEQVSAAVGELKSMLMPQVEPEVEVATEQLLEPESEPELDSAHVVEPTLEQAEEVIQAATLEQAATVEQPEEVDVVVADEKPENPENPENPEKLEKSKKNVLLRVVVALLIALVAVVVIYMLVGRLFPEWIDQFLYSAEELEIMRR